MECGGRCAGPSPFRKPEPNWYAGRGPACGRGRLRESTEVKPVALVVIEEEVAGRGVLEQAAGDRPDPLRDLIGVGDAPLAHGRAAASAP